MKRINVLPLALASSVVATMTGCANLGLQNDQKQIEARVPAQALPQALPNDGATFGSPQRIESRTRDYTSEQLVRASSQPWIGGMKSVPRTEDRLPAVFNEYYSFDFANNSSLNQVAARLAQMTGVPVRVRSDAQSEEASQAIEPQIDAVASPGFPSPISANAPKVGAPIPPRGLEAPLSQARPVTASSIPMKFNGRLRDYLDHLTNSLSLAWEYSDGAVVIMRLVSHAYDVAAFPGAQTFNMASGATGSGSADQEGVSLSTSTKTTVAQSGSMDARAAILQAVREMTSMDAGATVSMSDGSGRIVVMASRDTHARIRAFLDQENKALRRMVNVTFDIYSVRTKDNDQFGVDWSSVFQSLSSRYGVNFRTPSTLSDNTAARLGINVISNNTTTNSNAIVTLLSQYGNSTQHRPVSITTLNGQWDTKSRLSTDGYLKETVPGSASATGGAGAPGLKTDTVTTGDQFSVLPYVQSDNSVMVKYSIGLSDLLGLFDVSTGSGETLQKVQTPRIDAINASSTVLLAPGETAVITGLSRLVSKTDENRLTRQMPIAAGGSSRGEVAREHFIVLMRATPL